MMQAIENTAESVITATTNSLFDQGVVGAFTIIFLIASIFLLTLILKDKDYQKKMTDTLGKMVDNQKDFNEQYKTSQEHHKEVIKLVGDIAVSERNNSKECYSNLDTKLTQVLSRLGAIT